MAEYDLFNTRHFKQWVGVGGTSAATVSASAIAANDIQLFAFAVMTTGTLVPKAVEVTFYDGYFQTDVDTDDAYVIISYWDVSA